MVFYVSWGKNQQNQSQQILQSTWPNTQQSSSQSQGNLTKVKYSC